MTEAKLQPGDTERNLADDLRFVSECRFLDEFSERGTVGWPAAIRRALVAEAEVQRLRAVLQLHRIADISGTLAQRLQSDDIVE